MINFPHLFIPIESFLIPFLFPFFPLLLVLQPPPLLVLILHNLFIPIFYFITNSFTLTQDGGTPLHIAAYFGHNEIVTTLVRLGADIHAKNNVSSRSRDVFSCSICV